MGAADNLQPQQLKLFMGGREFQNASTGSTDTPGLKGSPELNAMWATKLAESKEPAGGRVRGAGVHRSLLSQGYQTGMHAPFDNGPTLWFDNGGVTQGEGHHRVAAAADIERTTGKDVWLPVNYQQAMPPPVVPPKVPFDPNQM